MFGDFVKFYNEAANLNGFRLEMCSTLNIQKLDKIVWYQRLKGDNPDRMPVIYTVMKRLEQEPSVLWPDILDASLLTEPFLVKRLEHKPPWD